MRDSPPRREYVRTSARRVMPSCRRSLTVIALCAAGVRWDAATARCWWPATKVPRLFPHLSDKRAYLFSDIPHIVGRGECDAGVLIHEGRFVYRRYGLFLLADLGVEWERATGLPLPLGVIVADRSLPAEVAGTAERVLRRSIAYAFAHPADSLPFVREHAQELDEGVIRNHIEFFVNDYSLDIGPEGAEAVARLLDMPSATLFRA